MGRRKLGSNVNSSTYNTVHSIKDSLCGHVSKYKCMHAHSDEIIFKLNIEAETGKTNMEAWLFIRNMYLVL